MNRFLKYIYEKSKSLYVLLYLFAIFLLIVVGSFAPYIFKSIKYSFCYEKEEMYGKIEDILYKEETVIVKRRDVSMPQYYFCVDDRVILVYPSHVRAHEIGDDFKYFLYVSEKQEIADCNNYSIDKGILGVTIMVFVCYIHVLIVWKGPKKKNNKKIEKVEHASKNNYNEMTAKELYALCQDRDIYVLESKKRNKEFLKKCLRSEDSGTRWLKKQEEKQFSTLLLFLILKLVALCVIAYSLMRTVHYLIYFLM